MSRTNLFQSRFEPFSLQEAEDISSAVFGLEGSLSNLTSERDQNFLITAEGNRRFVLKIAHPAEDPGVVAFQTAALRHIEEVAPALPVPRVVRTRDGSFAAPVDARDGDTRIARLLTYLPGRLMHEMPQTPQSRASIGECAARLSLALADLRHPAAKHELLWDLKQAHKLRPLLDHVDDGLLKNSCERALRQFEDVAAPLLAACRSQVVHNDLNPHNIVVTKEGCVAGVLDFGDMVETPLVCDVAVAASYHAANADPLVVIGQLLRAYHEILPLKDAEIRILFDLIKTRLAMTILITEWRAKEHPHNRRYILRNHLTAAAGLRQLEAVSHSQAQDDLLRICEKEKLSWS